MSKDQNWHTIMLGRDYYSLQGEIMDWCKQNVGPGGWYPSSGDKNFLWAIESSFGHVSISFRNQEDLMWFSLIWQ